MNEIPHDDWTPVVVKKIEDSEGIRADLEREILTALARSGGGKIDRNGIILGLMGRGASRPTLYRWYAEIIASGRPGQHVTKTVRRASERRAKRVPDAAADAARAAVAKLPDIVRVEDVAGSGAISVIERLQACLAAAEDVMKHARTPENAVRNAKLLLTASDHMRRSLDTAVRLYEAMRSVNQVDRFHDAIIEEISQESPKLAERIYRRLISLSTQWAV